MINSMTAFGRAQKQELGYSVTVEMRALNGRSLDVVIRMPKNCLEFEDALRKQITQSLRRGRMEVFIQIETTNVEQKAPQINLSLARYYWEQLQNLHRQLPGTDKPTLSHLLGIPYIFESKESEMDRETIADLLRGAVEEALEQVQRMRAQEGEALREDLLNRLSALREDLTRIESRKDVILQEYQARVRDRIQEFLGELQPDEGRILQEVACFADRADINEEIVRLKSHFDQIQGLLTASAPADGRRLDFLTQELHREVNTLGCKTNDLDVMQSIVRMKTEIGKLKEQVQNIE